MSEVDINSVAESKSKSSSKKTTHLIILTVSILLIIGIIASFIVGYLYAGIKSPNQKVVVMSNICNNDSDIEKLNGYLSEQTNSSNTDKSKEAIDYIKSKNNYSSDPTCVEALYKFSYIGRDFAALENYVKQLEDFANKGQYPSNRFDGTSSIYTNDMDRQAVLAGSS